MSESKDFFTVLDGSVFHIRANEFVKTDVCVSNAQARRTAMQRASRKGAAVVEPDILKGKDRVAAFTPKLVEIEVKTFPPGRPPGVPGSSNED